eukprot:m.195996 g.195996  ORF g.195996 m.195996 type:complete len:57 (-) comp10627_c2_seq4:1177-1347(-)
MLQLVSSPSRVILSTTREPAGSCLAALCDYLFSAVAQLCFGIGAVTNTTFLNVSCH